MEENAQQPTNPWYQKNLTPRQTTGFLTGAVVIIVLAWGAIYLTNRSASQPPAPGPDITGVSSFDFSDEDCKIPWDEVFSGGPPKDGIPALTDPKTISRDDAQYLFDPARVIGVEINGEARAYPLAILNYHEAVNDTVGGRPILVTYCPLCDSALVFDRRIDGEVREFGVSGLLYNSNVLLYDRHEDPLKESLWSQVMMKAVCGPAAKEDHEFELLPSELATWGDWQKQHPETMVLSNDTGHQRNYKQNPYNDYFDRESTVFPVKVSEEQLGPYKGKERTVIVQAGGELKGYPFSALASAADEDGTVEDSVGGHPVKLTITDRDAETVRVEAVNPEGESPSTAYSFWFEFRAMHPEAPVFSPEES